MVLAEFIEKYYLIPIRADEGYNFVNSITYAIIALLLLYAIYKAVQKLKIEVDFKFFLAVLPFVVLGSSVRAFVDHNLFTYGFWTVSPGIYLLIAGIFLASLFGSIFIQKFFSVDYWKISFAIGTVAVAAAYAAVFNSLQFENQVFGLAILGLAFLSSTILYLVFRKLKWEWTSGINFLPFPAHMLDASATFIAVDFLGAIEKHPLPTIVSGLANTAATMFLLKLLVLIPATYYLNKEIEDKNFRNYLLIAITVLGLAEGLRDLLTIMLI